MEYRRVEDVDKKGEEVTIFFKGTEYTLRREEGEWEIVARFRHKQQEDPDVPEDGRILNKTDMGLIYGQAEAIWKSRQKKDEEE